MATARMETTKGPARNVQWGLISTRTFSPGQELEPVDGQEASAQFAGDRTGRTEDRSVGTGRRVGVRGPLLCFGE